MKLVDCFMYFDEDLVLDIRLHTLFKEVDKFIIAEATKDHAGNPKKLNFKLENFSKFKNKIKYLVIDDLPTEVKSIKKGWHENHARDQFQRNSLKKGYKDLNDEDLKVENIQDFLVQASLKSKITLNIIHPNTAEDCPIVSSAYLSVANCS